MNITMFLSLLIISSQFFVSQAERCHPEDQKALLKIKNDLNNPFYLINWNTSIDCCSWFRVDCSSADDRIYSLQIPFANISGQIPDAVGDLPYLTSLMFHKITNLTGTIPSSIRKLTRLRHLTISWTNISGQIPSFFGELKNLRDLDLSFNSLSGSIPPELAQLRNLSYFRLDRNKLTGSIPESFNDLSPSLQYLQLSHNQISGTIPKGWGNLNMVLLDLESNMIEGDVSFLLRKNSTVQEIHFSRNLLEFDLSNSEFSNSLGYLDLNHNRITGSIPKGVVDTNMYYFNASYNRLCGRIPVGGNGIFGRLDYTAVFHNRCLCGAPLPDCK